MAAMDDCAAPEGPETGRAKISLAPGVALTIAGFDPSSGAGVTADLKVFEKYGIYGVAAIAALTIQSTQGVRGVEPVPGRVLRETLECLAEDLPMGGVKIGMLGSLEAVREVARFITRAGIPRERVVLDPVLVSSSGAALLEPEGIQVLKTDLLPVAGWVTPNLAELAALLGEPGEFISRGHVPELAAQLAGEDAERGPAPGGSGLHVVVTGGHLYPPDDFLRTAGGQEIWFSGERVETTSTHGTGCAFSSALLCRLLRGESPIEAVGGAKAWVRRALETAVPLGMGRGPVLSG
jgi:hydroxymethylpyrimidine/phosphomethylpyrimidine kinase